MFIAKESPMLNGHTIAVKYLTNKSPESKGITIKITETSSEGINL